MGKLTLPKQVSYLERNFFALKILYNNRKGIINKDMQEAMLEKFLLNTSQDKPMLNKQDEIFRYFGLIDYSTARKIKKITQRGIRFYESSDKQRKLIIEQTIVDKDFYFGKNNAAVPRSKSDLQPPIIFIRLIQALGYITNIEFAYALNEEFDFQSSIKDIIASRKNLKTLELEDYQNKYKDQKMPIVLDKWGIVNSTKKGNIKLYYIDEENINNDFYHKIKTVPMVVSSPVIIDQEEIDLENLNIGVLDDRTPNKKTLTDSGRWSTSKKVKDLALKIEKYTCEVDATHKTFLKKDGKVYMEGHHIIPMEAQSDYKTINLDRVRNIACLCPTCHRAAHFSDINKRKSILKKLFNKRSHHYKQIGIFDNIDQIFEKYYKK